LPPGRDFTGQVAPPGDEDDGLGLGDFEGLGTGVGDFELDVGDGVGLPPAIHRWLLLDAVLHVQSWTIVPLAVPLPLMSTHLADGTPVIVLLVLSFHFWLVAPLHVARTSFVPLTLAAPAAARHLVAPPMVTRSSPAVVDVQAWSVFPVQVEITSWVPVAPLPPVG
jgi:hypothetical protein